MVGKMKGARVRYQTVLHSHCFHFKDIVLILQTSVIFISPCLVWGCGSCRREVSRWSFCTGFNVLRFTFNAACTLLELLDVTMGHGSCSRALGTCLHRAMGKSCPQATGQWCCCVGLLGISLQSPWIEERWILGAVKVVHVSILFTLLPEDSFLAQKQISREPVIP